MHDNKFSLPYIIPLFLAIFLFIAPSFVLAQDTIPSSPDISYSIPDSPDSISPILPRKENISIRGKLKMQGLPVSPSLQIFMVPDSLIDISIRAPFVGEAGRMVITPDTAIVVNKMNKTFVKESITDFLKFYPGDISDLQKLLLAQVFIPGYDLEETPIFDLVDIYFEDNQYNVIPKPEAQISGVEYGFVVDESLNPLMLLILPESRPDIQLAAEYKYSSPDTQFTTYPSAPYSIAISYLEGDKFRGLTLELKEAEASGDFPKPLTLNKKFTQLSLSDFLRAF